MKKFMIILMVAGSITGASAQKGFQAGVKGSYNSTWLFNKTVSDKIDIQLYNVAGQKVATQFQKINGETYKVNTGDVSGNHFVTIRENNEMISKQILIIR